MKSLIKRSRHVPGILITVVDCVKFKTFDSKNVQSSKRNMVFARSAKEEIAFVIAYVDGYTFVLNNDELYWIDLVYSNTQLVFND